MTTKAHLLFDLFGGGRELARELGVDHSTVSRWASDGPRGNRGKIPTHYNLSIVEAARRRGIDPARIERLLDGHVCPCCERPLEPGQALDRNKIKAAAARA